MAAIINQAPRECRAARIKAGGRKEFIYPDDFPHLREHGGDFYAWQENGIWYIETDADRQGTEGEDGRYAPA